MSAVVERIHKATYEYPYLSIGYDFGGGLLHFHEETELLFVYEGRILLTVAAENHFLSPGDICVIPPGQIHTLTPAGPVKIHVMKLYPMIDLTGIELENHIYSTGAPHYDALRRLADGIIREDRERLPGYELAVVTGCGSILLYILRQLPQKLLSDTGRKKALHDRDFVYRVRDYLEACYREPFSLADISRHFSYSRSYFSRLFREVTGTNFIDYYTAFRLEKSLELLKSTRQNIETVALSVGFHSLRSYNRAFRARFGQSPGSYRKQFRKNTQSPFPAVTTEPD